MKRFFRHLVAPWRLLRLAAVRDERRRRNAARFERQFRARVDRIDAEARASGRRVFMLRNGSLEPLDWAKLRGDDSEGGTI